MSKAYSNRALPPGTVLREWRLEEILGVGGFGIVYKARGIYFNELVAIKEYFPSSISERAEDETVVPIDSNAEEVHALGLKKFVEEAKLLWNLSTPSRHPNIVSVRSLFEIHGTAYMVMDFEDGTPLSRLLKSGMRFNESSLKTMVIPICEGLERAHRVGVLHRDIKPPNIIVNADGRSVLIDFGSARFESGEATSTTVTFHTPPYAAIEQYVRTYPQGPWTDIYALGVVLYECVTGKKPGEVLERVHGDAGARLVDGDWPGFSKGFLAAIDAAMALRPEERPQSISEWLTLLKEDDAADDPVDDDDDDDVTRVSTWSADSLSIMPVAPPKEGFSADLNRIETGVPETPSQAAFTSREEEQVSSEPEQPAIAEVKPVSAGAAPVENSVAPVEAKAVSSPAQTAAKEAAPKPVTPTAKSGKPAAPTKQGAGAKSRGPLFAGLGVAAALAAGAWVYLAREEKPVEAPPVASTPTAAAPQVQASDPATALAALAEEAKAAGLAAPLLATLTPPLPDPNATDAAAPINLRSMLGNFAGAVVLDAQRRLRAYSAAGTTANPATLARLREQAGKLRATGEAMATAPDDQAAINSVRQMIVDAQAFNAASAGIRITAAKPNATQSVAAASEGASEAAGTTPDLSAKPSASSSAGGVSPATKSEFDRAVREARGLVSQVVRLGGRDRPGSGASDADRAGYRLRQTNAASAQRYADYLNTLEASMRGTTAESVARQSIAKANQTRAYLRDMLRQSEQSLK